MTKILAIDDINDNLISLKAIIKDAFPDSVVFSALNGSKGIELAIAEDPDVILLDIVMPGMDGFEVCRHLKQDERVRDIPVVFITALKGDKENRIKALDAGAEAFLSKPIDEIELTAQIKAMVKIKVANEQKRDESERLKRLVAERTQKLELSQIASLNLLNDLKAENEAHRKTEAALKESVQLFQGLFNVSPDAIILIDPHHPTISWLIIDCNTVACQMNGYSREELVGHSIDVLNEINGTKEERVAYFEELRKKGTIHKETYHRHKDGHIITIEVLSSIVTLGGKEMVLGIDRDITERKRSEDALRDSQALYHSFVEHMPAGVFRKNSEGRYIFVNSVFCQLKGLKADEILGKTPHELSEYESAIEASRPSEKRIRQHTLEIQADQHHESIMRTGKTIEVEEVYPNFDGTSRYLQVVKSPVFSSDGKVIGSQGIQFDITGHKRAEEALNKSNELLNKLTGQIPGVVYQYRLYPDGRSCFPYSSPGMTEIYGVTSEEVREDATPVFGRLHPDDYDYIVSSIQESARTLQIYHCEFRVILPGQGVRWHLCDAKPERMDDGSTLWYGIISDVTERKLADAVLKESEDRYRRFISQVSEGVYRFESDCPMDLNLSVEEQIDYIYDHMFIAECNNALVQMYGAEKQEDIIGKSHLDFHGGRNNEVNRASLRKFIQNGYTIESEITEEMNAQGKHLFFNNNFIGIIENNQLVRMWGTQINITEKMRADLVQQVLYAISNAALTSIELTELIEIIRNQLGKLLDSTNFYIAFYDEASGMLSTKFDQDEKDQIDCWPAEKSVTGYVIKHKKSLLAYVSDVVKLQEAGEIDMVGTPSKVWLGVPMILNNKAIGAIVVQSYDNPDAYSEKDKLMLEFISDQISNTIERKRAEKEINEALIKAQESDSLKSAFLANMSHEIRTPLNSIIGFSDLLLDPFFGSDQHVEFAGIIKDNGNNLLAIISDIMDLSKIEAGQVQVKKAVLSVNQLITYIQKEFSFKAIEKGIEFRLDPSNPRDEIFIESDENRLRQVLVNLVGNAIKFTEKGFVEIGISTKGDFVQFQINDTGIGIPKEFHDTIFERFRQVETAHTRKYGGNGLGLAISKSLVELLGGSIWMESKLGKGSTFYFKIPVLFGLENK